MSCPKCSERIDDPKRRCPFCSAELPESLSVVLKTDDDFIPGGVHVLDVRVTNNLAQDLRNLDFTMACTFFKEPIALGLGRLASNACVEDQVQIQLNQGLAGTAFLSLSAECVGSDGLPRVYSVRDTMKVVSGAGGGTQVINIQNSEFVQVSDLDAGIDPNRKGGPGRKALEFLLLYDEVRSAPAQERQCPFCHVMVSPGAETCSSCRGTLPLWLFKPRIEIGASGSPRQEFTRWRIVLPGGHSATRLLMDEHVEIGRHSQCGICIRAVDRTNTVKVSRFVGMVGREYGMPVYVRMHDDCHCAFMVDGREIHSSREQIPLDDGGTVSFGYVDGSADSRDDDFIVLLEYRKREMPPAGSADKTGEGTKRHTMNVRFTCGAKGVHMDTSILLLNSASIGSGDDMDICIKGLDPHHGNVIYSERRLWFENLSDKPCRFTCKGVVEDVPQGFVAAIPDEVSATLGRVVLLFEPF